MRRYLTKTFDWLLDLIFPVRCLGCGIFDRGYLCPNCLSGVKINSSFRCFSCGHPVNLGETCFLCRPNQSLDRLFVAADYEEPLVKKSIHYFKYSFIRELADPLADLMGRYLKKIADEKRFQVFNERTIVVPMPLDTKRFNWRGFNQAELLAKLIAGKYLIELRPDLVKRKRSNIHQADILDRALRVSNVEGLFCPTGSVLDKRIILIDDVSTTGATLNECAKALKVAGASEVFGLVIARG